MITLLQVSASWCAPCKQMRPIAEAAAEEAGAEFKYADIEDEDLVTVAKTVKSVPTFIVMVDGEEVERFVGRQDQQWIVDTLNEHK